MEGASRTVSKEKTASIAEVRRAEDEEGTSKAKALTNYGPRVDLAERNRKFWASKNEAIRNKESGIKLPFFPQESNADIVEVLEENWYSATKKFEMALVGFVVGTNPPLGKVRGFVRSKWGNEEEVKVSLLNEGIFLMKFTKEEKKEEIMMGGPWTFDNRPLILKQWSEDEEYKCGSIKSLPLWIRLPNIKCHLTDPLVLGQICSRIGKPLCTDGVTAEGTSYSFARVCVEVRADRELIDLISYKDPKGKIHKQRVMYEWKPPHCKNCMNFGHTIEACPEDNYDQILKEIKQKEDDLAWQQMNGIELELEEKSEETAGGKKKSKGKQTMATVDGALVVPEISASSESIEESKNASSSSKEDSKDESISDEITLAESFQQVLTKSAIKKAKKKEKKEMAALKAKQEAEAARDAEKQSKALKYKKDAKELREQEEREFNRRN